MTPSTIANPKTTRINIGHQNIVDAFFEAPQNQTFQWTKHLLPKVDTGQLGRPLGFGISGFPPLPSPKQE